MGYSELTPAHKEMLEPCDIIEIAKEDWDVLLVELGWRDADFSFDFLETSPAAAESSGNNTKEPEEGGHGPFSDAWVTSIALGVIAILAKSILRIDFISSKGATHLVQDIDY